ncbi:MAG: hypothetical protein ACOYD4_16010 [Solirubrobacterales bacterium]
MARGGGRPTPAMVVAMVALFVALGGSVYAATGIDGHRVEPKSLPGNRLVPGSLPADRLKPGAIPGSRLAPESVTGAQVDARTLGQVPSAVRADQAGSAREAGRALYALGAGDAASVNGHVAACRAGTRAFAGACWETGFSDAAATAAEAAAACASRGGELPSALAFVAFAKQAGVGIAIDGEWTKDIEEVSGPDMYDVVVLSPPATINWALPSKPKKYRCVLPLLS